MSIATTIPNDHTFTGNLTQSGSVTFNTGTGAVGLNGNTTVAADKTFTAGSGNAATTAVNVTTGTTTGTAVNINTSSLGSGSALNIDTGAATFGGNAVNIQSSGLFTGTLVNLSANTTQAGTVLGISATSLQTGAVINANLGAAVYTNSLGAIRLTANSASTGTLLAVSGTTLGANNGVAASFTTGAGAINEDATSKAVRIALGTQGNGLYANAAAGYSGNFILLQVDGATKLSVSATDITTTDNFSQTGATSTFSTGGGQVSLNGNTVIAANKNLSAAAGAGTFDFSQSTGTFKTSTGTNTLGGDTVLAANKNFTAQTPGVNSSSFDFSNATGTFKTSTGTNNLNGNTIVANDKTFTAGTGNAATTAVNVTTGTTSGTAVNVSTASLGAGLALSVDTGTALFTNNAVQISSSGNFVSTATLLKLSADSTTSGTILGISAAAMTDGRAINVQLVLPYTGGGAVNVATGAFGDAVSGGSVFTITAGSNAQNSSANLATLQGPLTQGRLLFLNSTGNYGGTGLLYMNIGGTGGAGTGISVNANSTYLGSYVDLRRGGISQFSIDPTNGIVTGLQFQLSGNFTQTGATTFSTGTGTVTLNGPVTISGANTFATGTGNISLNGNIVTNINQTGATTFTTGTGNVTLSGNTTVSQTRTFTLAGTGGFASTPLTAHYSATTTWDPANIAGSGTCINSPAITVNGAVVGDSADATPGSLIAGTNVTALNLTWMAYVSGPNAVTIRLCAGSNNQNGGNQNWRVDVWRH